MPPVACTGIDVHNLKHGKNVVRINWGSTKRRPSNTEIGSYESKGLKRKDAAYRLTRAWETGHLMCLLRCHLTRQWEQAPVKLFSFAALPTKQARAWQGTAGWSERPVKTPSRCPKSALC